MANETLVAPEDAGSKSNVFLILLTAVACFTVLVLRLIPSKPRDAREPPLIAPKIPYIGHLLGMILYQSEYLQILASRTTHQIFSLKVLSGEIYVITSPDLVQAVFKNPRVFSFEKISQSASQKVFGYTERQMKLFATTKEGDEKSTTLWKEVVTGMHKNLHTGDALLEMNTRALNCFAGFLEGIGKNAEGKGEEEIQIKLLGWIRHCFTLATTEALYGVENPVKDDPTLIQTLQDFEDAISLLYLDFYPAITAPSGHRARLKFTEAFKKYYDKKHYLNSSPIIQGRFHTQMEAGLNADDVASFDLGIMLASTMNSIPAVFWMLTHIYASPSLVETLRKEVAPLISREEGGKQTTMNVTLLASHCPILVSTWQETLRLTDATVSARNVTEDTILNDTYLLKKGGFVQLACGPMHTNPRIWGEDSKDFRSGRFAPPAQVALSREEKKQRKTGFAPFGGGPSLCPGRYFATTEILGVVATLVSGFDITSPYGLALNVPGTKQQNAGVQVKHPLGDVDVCMARRKGWEGVRWGYRFSESEAHGAEDDEQGVFD